MKNFFNAIGVADMERVHSAVIGWMLSDDCEAFGTGQKGKEVKSKLLCSIFGITPFCVFDEIKVNVEVYDIDILITTKLGPVKECWVIENKIKSNQHDNQLDKYVRIINGVEMTKGKVSEPITEKYKLIESKYQHYCLLSLINEAPLGLYKDKWCNTLYSFLYGMLNAQFTIVLLSSVTHNKDAVILWEYINCLGALDQSLTEFLNKKYDFVFKDGGKKKDEKGDNYLANIERENGSDARFISQNRLETIFQKCFLGELWKKYRTIYTFLSSYDWEITDSNGTAMLDIFLPDIFDNGTGKKYHSQIELQNGSFKIQIHHVDKNKKPESTKEDFLAKWQQVFENVRDDNNTNAKIWETNLPDTRPFISLSKSRKAKNADNWWKRNDINKWLNDNFSECSNMLDALIKEYEKWNRTTCSRI